MHICHVVKDNVGGAPAVANAIGAAHVEQGHKVSVIVLKEVDPKWNLFNFTNNIFVLNTKSNLSGVIDLSKIVNQIKPNIIISHGCYVTRNTYFSLLAVKNLSVPHIGYVHSDIVSDICNIRKEGLLKDLVRKLLSNLVLKITIWSLQQSDGLVFVCNALYERYKQVGHSHKNVVISYNPMIAEIQDIPVHPVAESWLTNDELATFVSSARLDYQKDHQTLLKAFAQVCKDYPHARLILLGDGHLKSELESLTHTLKISECILFAGYVPNPRNYYSLSRGVILSSHWEGFGMVLVEAVASGVTFIASDCPVGPREISEVLQCGTLVEPKDINGLAQAIIQHIKTPKEILDRSNQLTIFSISSCVNNLNNLINKLLTEEVINTNVL
ncbi:MAG: glycosyltransferase [Dolichospermum sp. DEX182a]|nr:glycosyltransferase [Dolichospermum sp. DEX182a]